MVNTWHRRTSERHQLIDRVRKRGVSAGPLNNSPACPLDRMDKDGEHVASAHLRDSLACPLDRVDKLAFARARGGSRQGTENGLSCLSIGQEPKGGASEWRVLWNKSGTEG